MANLDLVDPSCWPEEERKRRELIEKVRQIAVKIEYKGRGDTATLAKQLDLDGVKPLRPGRYGRYGKWYQRGSITPTNRLVRLLKLYLPDLWEHGVAALTKPERTVLKSTPVTMPKIVSKKDMAGIVGTGVTHKPVTHATREAPKNFQGWTVAHEGKRGIYKLVRRTKEGRKSIYIGKTWDPSLAAARIEAWAKGRGEEKVQDRLQDEHESRDH